MAKAVSVDSKMNRTRAWGGWPSSERLRLLRCGLADCLLRVARSSGDDGPWGVHDMPVREGGFFQVISPKTSGLNSMQAARDKLL